MSAARRSPGYDAVPYGEGKSARVPVLASDLNRTRLGTPGELTAEELAGELAEAAPAAVFCLAVAAAQGYGLIAGPTIDVVRCKSVIAEARRRGVRVPTLEEVLPDA